ncbi:sugar ABC transporter substrate-binding protein [Anaerolentibacter hominis]|uniref:sugar ABC transporter substrate-binding protein n=1 Tax=Anaerolentibacter hominis TaxID=3079009 RepID=UPI0031B8729F
MKQRKSMLAVLLIFTLLFSLSGCAKTDEPAGDGNGKQQQTEEGGKFSIGLVAKNQTDQFTAWQANEIMNTCQKDYADVFDIEMIDGEGDNAKIINAIETFTAKGVNAILVQPDDKEAIKTTISAAYDKGIIVITLSEKVDDGQSTSITSSEYSMGYLLGSCAAEKLPPDAKVVLIEGQAGQSAVIGRTEGIEKALSERGDIEVLVKANANWARDKAMNYMEDWLVLYPHIDGVLSHDDIMLLGAVNAIDAAGRRDEFSFLGGVDGLPEGCTAVKDGVTTCSVAQDAPAQAKAALDMVKQTLGGGEQKDVEVETELITSDNVDKWLDIHKAAGNME